MKRLEEAGITDERAMQEMQAVLDGWTAPEPSVWFETRMAARLREEIQRPPEGFFARLRDRWLFSSEVTARPMLAGALALLLAVAGGSYVGVTHSAIGSRPPAISAAVQDLQIIDNNDQALQQMDQLLDQNDESEQPQS